MKHLNRKRLSVFYGWWIVAAGFVISICAGVMHLGFTAFFEPIAREFGWSYAQVSLAASIRGMETGILAPVTGLMVDRYGPRRLVIGGAIILGLGLVLLSRTNSLAMFYGSFALIAMGMSACSGVVLMTPVTHWFRRKASMALSMVASGVSVGGLTIMLATILIDEFGWRMAILSLGLSISGLIMVLSLLLRHKPEQYGYLPDGVVEDFQIVDQLAATAQAASTEPKMSPRQILASRTFWHLALAFLGSIMAGSAVLTHIMPYLSSVGIDRTTSGLLASAMSLVSIFGRISLGWLGDRFNKKWLTVMTVISAGLAILLLGFITPSSIWLALPFIIFMSIGWGGNSTMMPVMVNAYFGRASFGTVFGFVTGVATVGSILGSPLAGWVFDTWGSYQWAWFGFVAIVLGAMVTVATTPPVTTSPGGGI